MTQQSLQRIGTTSFDRRNKDGVPVSSKLRLQVVLLGLLGSGCSSPSQSPSDSATGDALPNDSNGDSSSDGSVGAANVFAVGFANVILHYDGTSWTPQFAGSLAERLNGVWGSGPTNVFAVGFAVYHYDGISMCGPDAQHLAPWCIQSGTTAELNGVWGSGPTDVFAVGNNGTILHYNGVTWSVQTSGTQENLFGVWGSGPNDVFAVGSGPSPNFAGTILHYDGTSWTPQVSGLGDVVSVNTIRDVWGFGPTDVFAVGSGTNGTIIHYDGTSWSTQDATADFNGVWGNSPTDVFAVGFTGAFHYDGTSWTQVTPDNNLRGVWGNGPNDVFAVGEVYPLGTDGVIVHYDGTNWLTQTSPQQIPLHGVWGVLALSGTAVGPPCPGQRRRKSNDELHQLLDSNPHGGEFSVMW